MVEAIDAFQLDIGGELLEARKTVVRMHIFRLLVVLGVAVACSAVDESFASLSAGEQLRRLAAKGTEDAPKSRFPRESVGFFVEERARKQRIKKGPDGSKGPEVDAEAVLRRLRQLAAGQRKAAAGNE